MHDSINRPRPVFANPKKKEFKAIKRSRIRFFLYMVVRVNGGLRDKYQASNMCRASV